MATPKIRVLIVDDSAIVRKLLTEQLSTDDQIQVVGTAIDPYVARDKILELKPDVVTLDIEMPRMDGLTFLKILMKHHPLPIIILSSLTQAGSDIAMQALQLGAVDVMGKPGGSYSVGDVGFQLIEKIKAAASARLKNLPGLPAASAVASASVTASPPSTLAPRVGATVPVARPRPTPPKVLTQAGTFSKRQLILLGASTGGTEALKEVLIRLPKNLPPILIVQHIPSHFSKAFADRLNTLCDLDVREAQDGDIAQPGLALVAPGDFHLVVHWTGTEYRVSTKKGPMVWHQRPAVDVLFSSAAEAGAGEQAVVGLFTGMGKDGAEGMLKLRQKGATTYAQNEETCVVFGMPRAAMELGAAEKMLPLLDFPEALITAVQRKARQRENGL
jgi:two-component system chemotaxis response regulator CheB